MCRNEKYRRQTELSELRRQGELLSAENHFHDIYVWQEKEARDLTGNQAQGEGLKYLKE